MSTYRKFYPYFLCSTKELINLDLDFSCTCMYEFLFFIALNSESYFCPKFPPPLIEIFVNNAPS